MEKRKEKSDQNAVAELTREGLYKENKWLWEENKKLRDLKCVPSNLKTVIRIDKENERLEEENRTLREKLSEITMVADDEKQSIEHILELEEENKKLKETIKDHQLYEEKLEHRIIEFEELLHGE